MKTNVGAKIHYFHKRKVPSHFNPSHPSEEDVPPQTRVAQGALTSVGKVGECIEGLRVVLGERIAANKKMRRAAELKFKSSPLGKKLGVGAKHGPSASDLWSYATKKRSGHTPDWEKAHAAGQVHQVAGTHTQAQAAMRHDPYPPKKSWRDVRGHVSDKIAYLKRRVSPKSQPPEIP